MNRGVQGAVLITGVYGSGKSSVAQQIAHLLEKRNALRTPSWISTFWGGSTQEAKADRRSTA